VCPLKAVSPQSLAQHVYTRFLSPWLGIGAWHECADYPAYHGLVKLVFQLPVTLYQVLTVEPGLCIADVAYWPEPPGLCCYCLAHIRV
jgi:hypothetical protein